MQEIHNEVLETPAPILTQEEIDNLSAPVLPVSESTTPLTDRIMKTDLSPEEQMEFQMRIVREKQKHTMNSIQATLRGLLNMLTAPNMTGNKQNRIKKAIETGVLVGLDYGVDVMKIKMDEAGIYAKYEGHLGATIAQARENGMIIIANNFRKEEAEKQKASEPSENISVGGNDEQSNNNGNEENRSQTDQELQTSSEVETINQEGV